MKPEDNPVFKDESSNIVGELPISERSELGIMEILMIISIVVSLLKLIQACRQNHKDMKASLDKSETKATIRKAVKKQLGPIKDLRHGPAITKAILARAASISEDDFNTLLDNLDETEE